MVIQNDQTGLNSHGDIGKETAWQSNINSITDGILHIYKTKEFWDIEIIIGNQTFKAHKLILAAKCLKFREMLMKQNPPPRKITDSSSPKGFEILLRYIYTNEVGTSDKYDILEAFRAARKFEMKELIAECENLIKDWDISYDNVYTTLNEMQDIDFLVEHCVSFIKQNNKNAFGSEDFLRAGPNTLVQLLTDKCFSGVPVETVLMNVLGWGANQFPSPTDYEMVRNLLLKSGILGKLNIHKLSTEQLLEFAHLYPDFLTAKEFQQFQLNAYKPGAKALPDWCEI